MPTFSVLFELLPPAAFGLPEGDTIVIPAIAGTYTHDTYHRTGVRAAYGVLPQYRPAEDAFLHEFTAGGYAARIEDNLLRLRVEEASHQGALDAARTIADRLASLLSLAAGRLFTAVPRLVEGPDSDDVAVGQYLFKFNVSTYSLPELRTHVEQSTRVMNVEDERLTRASRYLQHALWLFQQRLAIDHPRDSNFAMLIASVFLNLWKSVSTIVGDPSSDRDYQSRYASLGLDRGYFVRLERLRGQRNDFDVAHYSLDDSALASLEATFAEALDVVRTAVLAYRDRISSSP